MSSDLHKGLRVGMKFVPIWTINLISFRSLFYELVELVWSEIELHCLAESLENRKHSIFGGIWSFAFVKDSNCTSLSGPFQKHSQAPGGPRDSSHSCLVLRTLLGQRLEAGDSEWAARAQSLLTHAWCPMCARETRCFQIVFSGGESCV